MRETVGHVIRNYGMTPLTINDQRSRLQPPQLDQYDFIRYPELGNDSTPPLLTIYDQRMRSRLQPPQLDQYDFIRPSLEPSHNTSLNIFPSFSMAPTKTTKKNAPPKSKVTQAEGLAPTKKNVSSKSKATQAKGKQNAASTAALQTAKKKNQLRNGSGLRMSYHEFNDSSTTRSRHLSIPRIPHCFGRYEHS